MIPIIHAIIRSIHKRLRQTAPLQFIIVLIAVVATVGVVKYFGKKGEWRTIKVQVVGRNWTNAFTNYEGYRPPYWLAEHVRINDLERGINGSITASVQRVETYSRGSSDFDMYLTLSINGIRNTKTGTLSYNGKIIEVGAPLELRLSDAQIMSQVIDDNVPPAGYNTKQIEAKIRFRNAEVWMISNIKVGDTMTSGPQGKTVATITAIATEPAQGSLIFTDTATRGGRASTGSVIIEQNNRLRDLLLTAILTIEQHNGEWFFGGHQNIKAGNLIWLYLPNVNVKGAEIETVTELPAHETKQK